MFITRRTVAMATAAFLCGGTMTEAQVTWRVSTDSSGQEGGRYSIQPSVSNDGRYVAFYSWADNLVLQDNNFTLDVFVHDRRTRETERVSVSSSNGEGDLASFDPFISADGRFVAFTSLASNLVPNDTNGEADIFVRDRLLRTTTRIRDPLRPEPNGRSSSASISANGQFVAFASEATNLVDGDSRGFRDVFVFDRVLEVTTRVTITSSGQGAAGDSSYPVISGNGRRVVFESDATNLIPTDTNNRRDIFVSDWQSGTMTRASVDSSGKQADGNSFLPAVSFTGNHAAFYSDATNLVDNDTNQKSDVFVHDLNTSRTTRVSVRSTGTQVDFQDSISPSMSANGQRVAFTSFGRVGEQPDNNGEGDVFLHDRTTGRTVRVSVSSTGEEGDSVSSGAAISGDGRLVAFDTASSTLVPGDTNNDIDVFVHGPSLILETSEDELSSGDALTLDTWTGAASQVALLAVVAINQVPTFAPVLFGTFDAQGLWSVSTTVPPGLAGLELDVQTVGSTPEGNADDSNVISLTFR